MSCNNVKTEYTLGVAGADYTFQFEYDSWNEIHVAQWQPTALRYLDISRDDWEPKGDSIIHLKVSIPTNWIIYRETGLEEADLATFTPGSSVRAQDLNDNFDALRHAAQEDECFEEEFYELLDEYIYDVRDSYKVDDQKAGTWDRPGTDEKIATAGAIGQRTDVYMTDNVPETLEYEQPGKRWYDTDVPMNYIWNNDIKAWINYSRNGPQGPRGKDGHHTVIMSLTAPKQRPNGDMICEGDVWFNTCNGDTFIFYNDTWVTMGNTGPMGLQGPEGTSTTIVGKDKPSTRPNGTPLQDGDIWFNTCIMETMWYLDGQWIQLGSIGPQGKKGDTGNYRIICSLKQPSKRDDGSDLMCGDIWMNTCIGEPFVYYNDTWLALSSPGQKGDKGEPGKDGEDGTLTNVDATAPIMFDGVQTFSYNIGGLSENSSPTDADYFYFKKGDGTHTKLPYSVLKANILADVPTPPAPPDLSLYIKRTGDRFEGGVTMVPLNGSAGIDLAAGNFFSFGAVDVPVPTNIVEGQSGIFQFLAVPLSFPVEMKLPPNFDMAAPSVVPYYVDQTGTILLGNPVEVS